jgi:phospholipid/cholesterol/gamma-HCH transport system substrate-binding protein
MAKQTIHNIKLGLFVIAGALFLIVMLFIVGKDTNMFSTNFTLRAQFQNVNGLMSGNNVRFSGIQVGTVKKIEILNDTTIEIEMIIDVDVQEFIYKNATVSIGSEGLMGNKIVNINPGKGNSKMVDDGDRLQSKVGPDTDEMLEVLYKTNNTVAGITANLKTTIEQINNSANLWELLSNPEISTNFKSALSNIQSASGEAKMILSDIHQIIGNIQNGEGTAGELLTDTTFAFELNEAIKSIHTLSEQSQQLVTDLNTVVSQINYEMTQGSGTAGAIMRDSIMSQRIQSSLENIEKGTEAFNENMEALKHSVFFKKYFKKQDKKKGE